jgi:hypothetical protein
VPAFSLPLSSLVALSLYLSSSSSSTKIIHKKSEPKHPKKKKINPDTQNSKIPMTTRMQCTNTDSFITLQLFGNEGEGACFC